jgi:hypothetical protein
MLNAQISKEFHKAGGSLGVIHIYSNSKEYLPMKYRQDYLKQVITTSIEGIVRA